MPSGNAIKLGDVIKGASGRTVEINNTDAECRLVLADALNYACGLKPERIIDLATLTGAIMVALGPHTVGLYANDEGLAGDLLASSELAGEHLLAHAFDRSSQRPTQERYRRYQEHR